MRKVYRTDEEWKEVRRLENTRYRAENSEKLNAYDRARKNTDECRAKRREQYHEKMAPIRAQQQLDKLNAPLPIPPTEKLCPSCDPPIPKTISEFGKNSKRPFGLDVYCKDCASKKAHARLDKRREYEQKRNLDSEHVQTKREKHTNWRHKNADKLREQQRLKYATDPEYVAMMRRSTLKWMEANPMRVREYRLRRKARINETLVSDVDYNSILARDGFFCYICEQPIDPNANGMSSASLTFDHVVPLIPRKGEPQGTHTEDNIRVAHMGCNVRKSNKPFETLTPYERRGIYF